MPSAEPALKQELEGSSSLLTREAVEPGPAHDASGGAERARNPSLAGCPVGDLLILIEIVQQPTLPVRATTKLLSLGELPCLRKDQ